jgi:3-oxoacyl-[acyl-carrier protein] reductase
VSSDPFRLAGRVAFVTGAGGGLGEGICTSLAAAGAAVACADVVTGRAEKIARGVAEAGGRSLALHADVADRASVEGAVARTVAELGGIDILVNNAAIYPRRAWTEITEEEWDRVLAVNLKAYFLCARACYPSMKERGRGHIVNVSSVTFLIGFEMLLDYVSSKGGIVGFTRALAHEVGPDGITVNAIAPGAFPTDAEKIHPDPEGYNQWALDQQCIKRRGTPRDIGSLVVFLSSDASEFITGQTIAIDGGWAMH